MKDLDTLSKGYMSQNDIFADAFNYLIYDGQQVIKPEQLSPLDTTELAAPYGDSGEAEPVQKFRDVLKYVTAMTDDSTAYLVLGIENQQNVHLAMPVRNMLYDALEYGRQVGEAAARHRQNKDHGEPEEFLSGFHRGDKLLPVITLVIYFGADEWSGPRSLYDMMDEMEDEIRPFVEDYKIHLIVPSELSDADFNKFSTSMRTLMKYIHYSKDASKVDEMARNGEFEKIGIQAAMVLDACTKSGFTINEKEEVFDVCQAIIDIRQASEVRGEVKGLLKAMKGMMANLHLSAEQAVAAANIPENERESYLKQLRS